ncbi:MAG: hypothetical protein KAU31_10120, partial [Spirochaetaceae bacterium]|nr:hypothetical protein [Spirochaetaceae bacterium]
MTALCKKFAKLLTIELESLEEELEILVQTLDQRLRDHEITDYVRNENYVVLRNEILGLRDFVKSGCSVDSDEVTTVDEAAALAKEVVRLRLEERGYVPALYRLIEHRVDKIAIYLN